MTYWRAWWANLRVAYPHFRRHGLGRLEALHLALYAARVNAAQESRREPR